MIFHKLNNLVSQISTNDKLTIYPWTQSQITHQHHYLANIFNYPMATEQTINILIFTFFRLTTQYQKRKYAFFIYSKHIKANFFNENVSWIYSKLSKSSYHQKCPVQWSLSECLSTLTLTKCPVKWSLSECLSTLTLTTKSARARMPTWRSKRKMFIINSNGSCINQSRLMKVFHLSPFDRLPSTVIGRAYVVAA